MDAPGDRAKEVCASGVVVLGTGFFPGRGTALARAVRGTAA
jgi:hypothetical protein